MRRFLLAFLVLSSVSALDQSKPASSKRRITENDKKAVVQAIEDEIYDEGCQGYGFDAAESHSANRYQLRVYIDPDIDVSNEPGTVLQIGTVIYKFLPLGEVYRGFSIESNGSAIIYGHPEWRFPPTGPNYLTAYMDDDELCRLKHDWVRTNFELDTTPPVQRVRDAQQRQKIRFGEQYRNHRRDCSFNWR
jgi:hypothetical protein